MTPPTEHAAALDILVFLNAVKLLRVKLSEPATAAVDGAQPGDR